MTLPCPPVFSDLLEEIREIRSKWSEPSDIVREATPRLFALLAHEPDLLDDEYKQSSEEHYARNLVYAEPDDSMSLFSLVWRPGQWTPVHDHGAWGLVAVVEGALEERNFIRVDDGTGGNEGVVLKPGGTTVLVPGSVTSFVPNPDHIHRAGVPEDGRPTVTLHLYGRNMDRYNVYDLEAGRKEPIEVATDNQIG
jgi:predicted metal-dependent enzyme (double-stranded beta helix superfamily)